MKMKWIVILGLQVLWLWAFHATLYQAVSVSMLVAIVMTLEDILDVLKYKLDSIDDKLDGAQEHY
jgi:hypothetical protein